MTDTLLRRTSRIERSRAIAELRSFPRAPAAILLSSVIFLRPNLAGESLSLLGFALAATAAAVALLRRDTVPISPGRAARSMSVVAAFVVAAYVAVVLKTTAMDPAPLVQDAFQDLVLSAGTVVAAVVVCQDSQTRVQVARGFVIGLAVLCASFVVTALIWAVAGLGAAEITQVPVGAFEPQPVYFPFTISYSHQTILGTDFPRFTGIGRESGWMAMYCAAAYFLADRVGLRSRRLKLLLLVGLVGCISTAGFGVFVVAWAWDRFLRPRGGITLPNYLRQVGGLAVLPLALWVATSAPIFGVSAKKDQNGDSLSEREDATAAGVRALFDSPWGGHPTEKQGGVNLISDIAVNGLPFVLLITCALLVPILFQRRIGKGTAAVLVVFLTLLLSQPPGSSAWAFCLVALAYGCDELRDIPRPHGRTASLRRDRGRHDTARRRRQGRPAPVIVEDEGAADRSARAESRISTTRTRQPGLTEDEGEGDHGGT